MFLGNPKDSVWEDWGTLGNIREDLGKMNGESPPPLKNPVIFGQIITTKPPSSHLKWWFSKGIPPKSP